MAYGADIDALGNQHRWTWDNVLTDAVGSVTATNTGCSFVTTPLCEGVTYSIQTNGTTDRVTIPNTTDINNSAQDRKCICGWFMVSAIQDPPKRIYGEGNTTQSFAIIMGWGNNIIFEVDSASFTLQIFGDTPLVPNRAYHLTAIFEGSSYGNEFRAYLDGVKQLSAEPTNRQPGVTTLTARTPVEFGDPVGTVSVGGVAVVLNASVNGHYNEWASFDGANAVLTDVEVREELFEKGALPSLTVTNQAGLDAIADTVRPNAPLCIRVTGTGTINLSADNITFDPLASIHVQYTGTGTLNWTNTNGSNASIGSVTGGGTLNFINPATLTIQGLINGCEIRIYDDEIADPLNFDTELDGTESNTGTSFAYAHSGTTNTVVVQMIADGYIEIIQRFVLGASDQTLTLFPELDGNV